MWVNSSANVISFKLSAWHDNGVVSKSTTPGPFAQKWETTDLSAQWPTSGGAQWRIFHLPTPQPVELGECIGVQLGDASNDNLLLYWTTYPWPDTESWTETAGGLAWSSTTALQYASHPLRNGTQGGYGVPLAILGAYRSDGPAGNLLGLKTSYSLDGLHLNQAGYTAVMQYIYAQAIPWLYSNGLVP